MPSALEPKGIGSLAYPFYSWFAGDERPRPTDENATGYEIDTRREFVWKNREWYLRDKPLTAGDFAAALTPVIAELGKIRLGIEMVLNQQLPG